MSADLWLDALDQALLIRDVNGGFIHLSDKGSQYLSIRYIERLAEIGISASAGFTADAYDKAMAEAIKGLHKVEVIRRQGPRKSREEVERATATSADYLMPSGSLVRKDPPPRGI
jgi:transposase InsO family protein